MKNSDKPSHPFKDAWGYHHGLTKREYFAGLAMQGLLSANATYQGRTDERPLLCQDAIAHADELLKQLENNTDDK